MTYNIKKHPTLTQAKDMSDICQPLNHLGINYFSHVRVDNDGRFATINSNPDFFEFYFNNKFYNADIHTADTNQLGKLVIWDECELNGDSEKLYVEAEAFGLMHTCTIIEPNETGQDFYHFSSKVVSKAINQTFISNTDLLKTFIQYFKANVKQSKRLSETYDLWYKIDPVQSGYRLTHVETARKNFERELAAKHFIVQSDDIQISPQKLKCLVLLAEGHSIKSISTCLSLSPKTVEHYLEAIRKKLSCKNSKELIVAYYKIMQAKSQ